MEWLRQNTWAIVIGILTLTSTFTLYGYQIAALDTRASALEIRATSDEKSAAKLSTAVSDTNLQTQISLTKIQVDIEYIKARIDKAIK